MAVKKKTMASTGEHKGSTKSLFGEPLEGGLLNQTEKTLADTERFTTKYISLDRIMDNKSNRFSVKSTDFLEKSILKLGQLQPIILVPEVNEEGKPTGNYEIKSGSRRYKALNNIVSKAKEKNEQDIAKRYMQAFCTILPLGATQKEIDEVITETNTTARHISLEDLFRNFEFMFEIDNEGNFINISKNENKYEAGARMLKDMGYDYSPTSVKEFLTIYMAHNKEIRKDFENGFLNRTQALTVARMPAGMQDSVMEKFKNFTDKEISDYIKTYNLEKKENKTKNLKGIDVLNDVAKTSKKIKTITSKKIHFKDDVQKNQVIALIEETYKELDKLMEILQK